MIHNDVLNQLQLLVKTSAPPLVEVSQTPLEEPQWVPGQRLNALVLANLPNGRFQVQVGEMILDMNLPRNTQPGENLELTFVSNQPRLTFVLSKDLAAAASASGEAKPNVTLSDTARFLGALIQKIADQSDQAAAVTKSTPVLSSAPAEIKEFAAALRNTLSQSGLFYESHQAQWVAGERKLADLLQEPQGRLATITGNSIPETAGTQARNVTLGAPADAAASAGNVKLPVHAEAISLVQQQLQTLDTRQLVWQGQVWPGQSMEWRVEERNARQSDGMAPEIPNWQTSLRLQLPRLGNVQAVLSFAPQGLRVDLKADAGAVEIMKSAQEQLRGSMEASGLRLLGLTVDRNEKAG